METIEVEGKGEYEETAWIEMQEDEDDDINCLGMFDDPDPMDLFVHEFYKPGAEEGSLVTITVEGFKAENGQQLNSTGLTLWRAAPILCSFLVGRASQYVVGKHVLELGAGLGLCGILAGALGAAGVCMTDGDSASLQRMRDNVVRNRALTSSSSGASIESVVQCKQLRWGQQLEEFRRHCSLSCASSSSSSCGSGGSFDVVMGSDIIYTPDILEPLFETVDFLLSRGGGEGAEAGEGEGEEEGGAGGVFLLAYARRNVKIDDVLVVAERRGFQWSQPEGPEGCFVFWRRRRALQEESAA